MGFNAAVGRFENMVTAGVIDPMKVRSFMCTCCQSVGVLVATTAGARSRRHRPHEGAHSKPPGLRIASRLGCA